MELYPLKFTPIYYEKIWGGNKIKTVLNKNYENLSNCGESWEISTIDNAETIVNNGYLKGKTLKKLISIYKSELVGSAVYDNFGENFPLLVKFIDATDDLSVQVHPNDALAKKRYNMNGKSEIWYIIDADYDAKLISGFNKEIRKEEYIESLNTGKLNQILNLEKVNKGDVFYIPSGRVHAICKGILLAEIQQTSDITYRIYDWDRLDKNGNSRELHVKEAVDAINYEYSTDCKTEYNIDINKKKAEVLHTPYFNFNIIETKQNISLDYTKTDSFVIYVCVEGEAIIDYGKCHQTERIFKGDVLLIPNKLKNITIITKNICKILEVTI